MVRHQLALITSIRSDVARHDRVQAWSEAMEALADLVAPWGNDDKDFQKAWADRPCAVVDMGNGHIMAVPTASDCREAQRILTAMMDRQGLLVKRRVVSGPGPRTFPADAPTAAPQPATEATP
jgi:hypothetical protein